MIVLFWIDILLSLVVGLGGILEPASVLNGDGLALDRNGTGALLDDGLLDAHVFK